MRTRRLFLRINYDCGSEWPICAVGCGVGKRQDSVASCEGIEGSTRERWPPWQIGGGSAATNSTLEGA